MNRAPRPIALLRTLGDDRRGLAMIEFAFSVPILALLFVGAYQLMDAISAYRKVTTTVRTLADLTTQSPTMTATSADQIIAAAQQVMSPYPTATATMRITQLKIDGSGNATVDWSRASANGTAYAKGAAASPALPTQLVQNNTSLIYSEISYQYLPNIAAGMIGTIPLSDSIYMAPRSTASIPCPDC